MMVAESYSLSQGSELNVGFNQLYTLQSDLNVMIMTPFPALIWLDLPIAFYLDHNIFLDCHGIGIEEPCFIVILLLLEYAIPVICCKGFLESLLSLFQSFPCYLISNETSAKGGLSIWSELSSICSWYPAVCVCVFLTQYWH